MPRHTLPVWTLMPAVLSMAGAAHAEYTFSKDILPILQNRCQECHRPGEIGPMSLMTYKEVRPWAKAIKESVLTRKMPPWHADPSAGRFKNDHSLTDAEIRTVAQWAEAGAPEGSAKNAPAARMFPSEWNIGVPDIIVEPAAPFEVPAQGTVEYIYFIVPTGFKEDRWVEALEVRPGNRAVVHHAAIHLRPPDSKWLRNYPVGTYFVPTKQPSGTEQTGPLPSSAGAGMLDERLAGYVPGKFVDAFPRGQGRLIPAGSDIVFILHYTTNGKPASDRTRLGLRFAKEPPAQRVYKAVAVNPKIVIPPGAPNHKEEAVRTIYADCDLLSIRPHMHLRGKAMEFRVIYSNGESEVLLRLPRYDFNWQLEYILDRPRRLTKGSRLEVTGIFDNSANNPRNPDPKSEVRWGDQSWDEMLAGFFELAFDASMNLDRLFSPPVAKPGEE